MDPLTLYSSVIEVRNTELQLIWTRFNIHLLVNGGLLVAFLTSPNASPLHTAPISVPLIGLSLGVVWLASELAGRYNLNHFNVKVKQFEDTFWDEGKLAQYRLLGDRTPALRRQGKVSLLLIGIFLTAWTNVLLTG